MDDLKILQQILNKLDILDDVQKDVKGMKNDVKGMKNDINEMQKDINEMKNNINEMKNDIKDVKNEQGEIISEISFLATKVGEFQQDNKDAFKNIIDKNDLKV